MKKFEKKRIVVKVGTSTLTHANTHKINIARMAKLVSVLADLHNMGHEVVLVSSGAIAVGTGKLGLKEKPQEDCELMFLYDKLFSEYNVIVSQLLFTTDVLKSEESKGHLLDTFNQLLKYDVIPVINENDSISVEELRSSDNDCMSAIIAELIDADMLIMFTDTDGLYDSNPRTNPNAKLISIVEEITHEIKKIAGGAGKMGTGGFSTKVKAAEIATGADIPVIVCNGEKPTRIYKILDGESVGTLFLPKKKGE